MEIKNFKDAEPGKWWVATFDVYLPKVSLIIRNCKLVKAKTGNHFTKMPDFFCPNELGEKKYLPCVEFTGEIRKAFEKELLDAVMSTRNASLTQDMSECPF